MDRVARSAGNSRNQALTALESVLEDRQLVWLGIRGEDADGLADIPGFAAAFGITAPFPDREGGLAANVTLEELSRTRVDLDDPLLDVTASPGYQEFRRLLLDVVRVPSVLVPYRPTDLSTSVALSKRSTVTLAGMLSPPQIRFEYKPWVEMELSRRGVPVLSWEYVADEDREAVAKRAERQALVLRPSANSGGAGIVAARSAADVQNHWPSRDDALVAVSPFLDHALSINFSGVAFSNGSSRMHPPSVQLVGVPDCTARTFGYCGNDFGAIRKLDPDALLQLERIGRTIAAWLHAQGYVGAFGVDALYHEGSVWFTEINARFQGSSSPSAQIARTMGVADLYTDHLLATLGVGPLGDDRDLAWWAREQPSIAHVVVHNTRESPITLGDLDRFPLGESVQMTQLARNVVVEPGGTLGRLLFARSVTQGGALIDDDAARHVRALQALVGMA